MKILYITSLDLTGQQFNGFLLKNELEKMGHEAHLSVFLSEYNVGKNHDDHIHTEGNRLLNIVNRSLIHFENWISLQRILGVKSLTLFDRPYYKEADIVHIQLPHILTWFSLLNLPRICREKKTVWTLHDPWLMTGHCVHPMQCERWMTGCGHCPDLDRAFKIHRDTTALNWKIKQKILANLDMNLIVASKWMQQMVGASPLISHLECTRIPFGLDLGIFYPRDKKMSKRKLGIPEGSKVISFRAQRNSPHKGTEYILDAMEQIHYQENIYLLLFEDDQLQRGLGEKFKVIGLSWVEDQERVADALSASDLFLSPSVAEAFGVMPIEAMACGTPVIVFDGTALPDVINAPRGGVVVPYKDSAALAREIDRLLTDMDAWNDYRRNALDFVQKEYPLEKYVHNHLSYYESLLRG